MLPRLDLTAPRLHSLSMRDTHYSPEWLACLARLQQLQRLHLEGSTGWHRPYTVQLPTCAHLTSLDLNLCSKDPLQLSPQPPLVQLAVTGGSQDLRLPGADAAALPALQQLEFTGFGVEDMCACDFRCMPALHAARLFTWGALAETHTIAAATAPTRLELRTTTDDWDADFEKPWTIELLRSLPSSVRALCIKGAWGCGLAAALGRLTQLRALELIHHPMFVAAWDAEDAEAALAASAEQAGSEGDARLLEASPAYDQHVWREDESEGEAPEPKPAPQPRPSHDAIYPGADAPVWGALRALCIHAPFGIPQVRRLPIRPCICASATHGVCDHTCSASMEGSH